MKYRLYIDEVGNPGLGPFRDQNNHYLSLTGVILDLVYVSTTVFPAIEGLKRDFFGSHPDDPVILHRKEIVNHKHPFESLSEPEKEKKFGQELLCLLQDFEYKVITIVIDKQEYYQRGQASPFGLYNRCMIAMVEQYVHCLESKNAAGDVMAESRGGEEDKRMKSSFEKLYTDNSERFSKYLTSSQLKVKPKSNNVSGLQLADIIAHPSHCAILAQKGKGLLRDNFGRKIAEILEANKYFRNPDGQIDGWGRRWLP